MSDQWTLAQIEEISQSIGRDRPMPVCCTCRKEAEPLFELHDIGCSFRMEAVNQMIARHARGEVQS